jgi:hypothetical protein
VSGKVTFSIPKSAKITTSPGPYENCCRIFKSKALKKKYHWLSVTSTGGQPG